MSIDINYYSFSLKRANERWDEFREDFLAIRQKNMMGDNNLELNPRQEKLLKDAYAGDIFYTEKIDDYDVQYGLKAIDLYYGAVINDRFESPKVEFNFLENIVRHFGLEVEANIPTKKEWIRLFETLKTDDILAISEMLVKEIGWEPKEARDELVSYLKSIRPVMKDLKEVDDAIFLSWYGGTDKVEPESSEGIMYGRFLDHKSQFQDVLGEILE